jgi:PAS domain S-box-containing protein
MLSRNALRQLMAQAASPGSLQTVYQTALRGVQDALDVERASLLVFDAAGTMRFVAWSGLSDGYRAAVDGHSPWQVTETAAMSILIADIEQDETVADLRPVFRREHIRALAFVPLQFGTRLLGKFMLYYREPHTFSEPEVAIAEQIAGHVAFAFEHHRVAVELESRLVLERELRLEAETEAALREANERRLNLALAAGRMGAWDWDIASGRVNWSSEVERAHGLQPGTFEGTLDAYRRDIYPADAERLSAAIAAALDTPDAPYDVEYRIVRTDGALRWLSSTGRVIVGSHGRPIRMVGICRDVTERKRVEEASAFVAQASRVLATTLSPEAIVENLARLVVPPLADWCIVQVTDAEGRLHPVEIAHQNAGPTALVWELVRRWPSRPEHFGSAASVVSTGQSVLLPHISDELLQTRADDPEPLRILQSLGFRSAITVPLQARGRTFGALQLISAESARIYNDADLCFAQEIASWAALAIDNAQLYRQAEEARVAAETARAQLETLATVSDQIAVSLDPDDALRQLARRVVPAFADYCITYAAADDGLRPLGFAHRDSAREPLVERLAREFRVSADEQPDGGALKVSDCSVLTAPPPILASMQPDAEAVEARTMLEPRSLMTVPLNARGRTLGAILFATTNDSGRRFGEADLKVAVELASRAALLVDNARLYAEARSAVRSRDELVAFISHDLRDPLQSISAATATLRLGPQTADNAESLESITRASAQMRRLVQDLLDVSMLEAGRLPVNREPVDLRDLILEVQTLALPQIKASQTGIETRLAADLPCLAVDRHRILQVLLNLVGNALKFVGPGGRVTIGVDRQADAVRIWVHDNGSGISVDQLDRVFDRFWRAGHGAGAGLGLAVAKGIVEAHGGQIGVTSESGAGTLFFFTLPLQAEAVGAPVVESAVEAPPKMDRARSCRVLLVDDDRDVVRALVRLVRSLGHETHVAYSGEEALQVAEQCQPQIILMDIGLPGLNGYDTAREMRARPWGEAVTLIAVTGWVREDDRRRALESGFDRHLTKPVDASLLEALLNGAAEKASPAGLAQ